MPHDEGPIAVLASCRRLLVAVDFDGTLAAIVTRPSDARPASGALEALAALAGLPSTRVAVVSGRALDDLAARAEWPRTVDLVGSHGAESRYHAARHASGTEAVARSLESLAARCPGAWVERKPFGAAVHVREAPEAHGRVLVESVRAFASQRGLDVLDGKMVVEVSTVRYDKGRAVAMLRRRTNADRVLYVGDDRTDEDAFAALGEGDVAVKVGAGPSRASLRVDGPDDVVALLARLADLRSARRRSGPARR